MKSKIVDRISLSKVCFPKGYTYDDEEPRDLIIKCKLSEDYTEEDFQNDYRTFENKNFLYSLDKLLMCWEVEIDNNILPNDFAYIIVDDKVVARSIVYGFPFVGISELGMDPKKKYIALEIDNMLPLDWEEPVTINMLKSEYPDFNWEGIKSGMVIDDYDASYVIDDCFYHNSGEVDEYDVEEMMIENYYDDKYWD